MVVGQNDVQGASVMQWPSILRESEAAHPRQTLQRIRSMVLLGGSVVPTPFRSAIGRSLLDLPLKRKISLGEAWCGWSNTLAQSHAPSRLTLRVMIDRRSPRPLTLARADKLSLRIERDPSELRGTGGLLRDLTMRYAPDDRILVAGAGQVLLKSLSRLVEVLFRTDADISLLAHTDGTPVTLMLIRCGCLRQIPDIGFADLKEQVLPALASTHKVRVIQRQDKVALTVRTLSDYISALQSIHSSNAPEPRYPGFHETWKPRFALVEKGAMVSREAQIHDSVVLAGAQVAAGAIVVRSLVCPGARVRRKQVVVDQLVTADRGPGPTGA